MRKIVHDLAHGKRLQGGEGQPCPNGPVLWHTAQHRAAQGPDTGQDSVSHVRPDIDDDDLVLDI